jgi:hypothetical protein
MAKGVKAFKVKTARKEAYKSINKESKAVFKAAHKLPPRENLSLSAGKT